MRDLETLKELPLGERRVVIGVEAGGDSSWHVLGADPKANLRLMVEEKWWFL